MKPLPHAAVLSLVLALMPACDGLRRGYASPEAAALTTYLRLIGSYARAGRDSSLHQLNWIYVNVPPSQRLQERQLARALIPWAKNLKLLRDTSLFARASVPEESLAVYRAVFDVRPVDAHTRLMFAHSGRFFGAHAYMVFIEACRGWPCHDGMVVEVAHSLFGYRTVGQPATVSD